MQQMFRVNEKRKIKVRVNKSKFEEEDEETTTWLFGKSTSDTKNLLAILPFPNPND